MKVQRVVKFVLVMALVIGVTGYVASVVAQTAPSTRAAAIKLPPPPTKPNRPDTPPKVPTAVAGTAALTNSVMSVSGQALRPKHSLIEYDYWGMGGGCIYATNYANDFFSTQIYLPQGANIYALRMYFFRLDTSYNCTGYLKIYNPFGAVAFQYPILTGDWTGWNYGDDTLLSHTVDNYTYTYLLEWVPEQTGSEMSLASFMVYMTNPPATAGKVAVIPLY